MQQAEFENAQRSFQEAGVLFEFACDDADKALVDHISNAIRTAGATGVTSVGCGQGVLEYLLSFNFPVQACDVGDNRMPLFARKRVSFESVRQYGENSLVPAVIPDNSALLFCFATMKGDARELYFRTYQGPLRHYHRRRTHVQPGSTQGGRGPCRSLQRVGLKAERAKENFLRHHVRLSPRVSSLGRV